MKNKKGSLFIITGLLLMAAALCLAAYNFYEDSQAEEASRQVMAALVETEPHVSGEPMQTNPTEAPQVPATDAWEQPTETQLPETQAGVPDHVLNPEMPMPVKTLDGRDYIGILEIPACDLVLPVISQWSYPNLKVAPCRYFGSVYTENMVVVAHNYKSHFRRLKELGEGDLVRFTDVDGNIFSYEVMLFETLEPTAVEEMTAGEWDLTLFTCTTGGSYRLTVRCQKIP